MRSHFSLIRLKRTRTRRAARLAPATKSADRSRTLLAEVLGYPLRTKLKVGAPDDAHEREADTVAERVMAMPEDTVQRKCAACQEEDQEEVRRKPEEDQEKEREKDKDKNEEELKTKAERGGTKSATVAADVATRIQARRGEGVPLSVPERSFYEPRFGTTFGRVRLHTDQESATLAQRLAARAFTIGNDVFFNQGEYHSNHPDHRRLLAHELTHVVQQREPGGPQVRRWALGAAPAPHGWRVVADARQQARLDEAEDIVRGVVGSRNCQNYFRDNCTNGGGANTLRNAFNNARVYLRPVDDNIFGEGEFGGNRIAFNLRAFRIGRYMMASTLLHEMFHNCDPRGAGTGNPAELDAENAVERCRLHTPWIDTVSPQRGPVGTRVRIRGWGFGPTQGATDLVRIGGMNARVVSWSFMTDTSSRVEIVVEIPAGATTGDLVVINNNVSSNAARFRVV